MLTPIRRQRLLVASLSSVGALALLVAGGAIAETGSRSHESGPTLALEGYCPVCVVQMRQWVPGDARHQTTYDGKIYYFPSDKERQMFLADPAKYVPALGGDCTICYAGMGKRVPGNIRHSAIYQKRLYLFPSDKQQEAFLADPAAFADVDLALDGNCAVCLAHMGKQVAGKPEFTAVHNGFRYRFPSDRERQAFLADPAKYAIGREDGDPVKPVSHSSRRVSVTGRSGCAACEHGVTPIGASDTMGLAVNTADGEVYVIEDAHKLYPETYKDRFSGLRLKVSGEILKQEGKIAWIRPTELVVLN
jgi:YHS domain-containing protein